MRKVLIGVAAFFAMSTVGWAGPCVTASFSSYESLGSAGCTGSDGVVIANFSGTLPGGTMLDVFGEHGEQGTFDGVEFPVDFSSLAGTSSTLSFTMTAPPGLTFNSFVIGPGGVSSGSATLTATLSNGLTLTATSTSANGFVGGVEGGSLPDLSSLTVNATLTVAPGTTSLAGDFPPDLFANNAPEPATFSLAVIGLLGLGLFCGSNMREG